jgi:hypothetical protein
MAFLGSFAGPAAIGAATTATHLGTALLLPVAAAAIAALGAGILNRYPSPRTATPAAESPR